MKTRLTLLLVLVGAALVVGVVAVALTFIRLGPPPAAAPEDTQRSTAGNVEVQATLMPAGNSQEISFTVEMNTHSVELGQYDLAKLSRVTLEPGGPLTEFMWHPKEDTGHHIAGMLTVKDPNRLLKSAKSLTLEITGLATPEARQFQWPLGGR